jgi:1-acyl-sn-glycerol-3-phosphate acyltransferase
MPVTIIGGHESWPPARRLPRPGRLTIVYHPIITPPVDVDVRSAARDLAHRVHAVVASALPSHQRPDTLRDAPA